MHSARFRLNSPQVISETIEGEGIVVNLGTGSYYSVRDTGALLWEAIIAGAPLPRIVDALVEAYDVDRAEAEDLVRSFCEQLEGEGLVARVEDAAAGDDAAVLFSRNGSSSFKPPALEKYTDMQDLVLIDPVHEVDERGWPHAQSQS